MQFSALRIIPDCNSPIPPAQKFIERHAYGYVSLTVNPYEGIILSMNVPAKGFGPEVHPFGNQENSLEIR